MPERRVRFARYANSDFLNVTRRGEKNWRSKIGTSTTSFRCLRLGIREKGLIAPASTTINRVALDVGRAYLQCAFERQRALHHGTINNYDLSRRGGLKIIRSRLHCCGPLRWWHGKRGRRELWLMHICCISSLPLPLSSPLSLSIISQITF